MCNVTDTYIQASVKWTGGQKKVGQTSILHYIYKSSLGQSIHAQLRQVMTSIYNMYYYGVACCLYTVHFSNNITVLCTTLPYVIVSARAFRTLTWNLQTSPHSQSLWPESHLSGMASHPSHYCCSGIQRWRHHPVGLRCAE